ncbi:MAG: shikimate kinase [Alphaproteobacteria bacterium]|nr:shikimate kinase [Alphaproteobacteria bacterium]
MSRLQLRRTVALVGLMGAGKTSIGRRLAQDLGLPFIDADHEIEEAAGQTIEAIFEQHGEAFFRDGEHRVIARLLDGPPHVLATGGGAFMDGGTRGLFVQRAITIWIKADIEILLTRLGRRNHRPLLKHGDKRTILTELMAARHPIYAEANITIEASDGPPEEMVVGIMARLKEYLAVHPEAGGTEVRE